MNWTNIAMVVAMAAVAVLVLWPKGDTEPAAALAAVKAGALLVDVRSIGEHARGAVPGAIHAPVDTVLASLKARGVSTEQPLVLYCAVGSRSSAAAGILKSAGYRSVHVVRGGYADLMKVLEQP